MPVIILTPTASKMLQFALYHRPAKSLKAQEWSYGQEEILFVSKIAIDR